MRQLKKTSSYKIDATLLNKLLLISKMKNSTISTIIEDLVRNYVITNKSELNEFVSKLKN